MAFLPRLSLGLVGLFALLVSSCGGGIADDNRQTGNVPGNVPSGSGTAKAPDPIDPPPPIDPPKPPPSWHVELAQDPKTEMVLTGVWGSSASDVWVVGEFGLILHRENGAWKPQASTEKGHLWSVWGKSATDVFVGADGAVLRSTGNGQWKREPLPQPGRVVGFLAEGAAVMAVIEGGYLVRTYGGGTWTIVPSSSVTLAAATRLSSGAIYAVGPSAQIHGGSPGAWKEEKTDVPSFTIGCDPPPVGFPCDPASYKPALFGVWGSDPKNLYAVGQYGVIVHSTGGEWKVEHIEKTLQPQLFGITATSPSDLWVAGDEIVLHGEGKGTWASIDVGAKDNYRAAWSIGTDVYIVGGHTIVHRY